MTNNTSTTTTTVDSTATVIDDAALIESMEIAGTSAQVEATPAPAPTPTQTQVEAPVEPAPAETPAPKQQQKAPTEKYNLPGVGEIRYKGNLSILTQGMLISFGISQSADSNGRAEAERIAQELVEQGYRLVFSGLRKEDLWGINSALKHGGQVVIFLHEGINTAMKLRHEAAISLKDDFHEGNVLFVSFSLNEKYSEPEAQRRNKALAKICKAVFLPQIISNQKVTQSGKKIWGGGAMDLVERFHAAKKPIFLPKWNEEQPAAHAVVLRKFGACEVESGELLSEILVCLPEAEEIIAETDAVKEEEHPY